MRQPVNWSAARLGVAATLLALAWSGVAVYAGRTLQATNPLALPLERTLKPLLVTLLPQGWAFFTKSPRDVNFFIYRPRTSGWSSAYAGPLARPRNAFGLNRLSRAQGVEFGLLTRELKGASWRPCTVSPKGCLSRYGPPVRVRNPSPQPLLCGTYGFVEQRPVPWAWARSRGEFDMPSRSLVIEAACS